MKLGLEGGLRAKSRGTPEDEKSAEGWTKRQLCSPDFRLGNPKAAPYGSAATQVLVKLGLTGEPNLPLAFVCFLLIAVPHERQKQPIADARN